jgi:hypothetical protein
MMILTIEYLMFMVVLVLKFVEVDKLKKILVRSLKFVKSLQVDSSIYIPFICRSEVHSFRMRFSLGSLSLWRKGSATDF